MRILARILNIGYLAIESRELDQCVLLGLNYILARSQIYLGNNTINALKILHRIYHGIYYP